MPAVKKRVEIEVSTDCECTTCPQCGTVYTGDVQCDECEIDTKFSEECFECQPYDYLQEEVESWIKKARASTIVSSGKNMGWTHASGEAETEATYNGVMALLSWNGDHRLKFVFETNEPIRVTRYSHDEPTGAQFEIYRKVRSYQRKAQ